jgi:hypothetical protein
MDPQQLDQQLAGSQSSGAKSGWKGNEQYFALVFSTQFEVTLVILILTFSTAARLKFPRKLSLPLAQVGKGESISSVPLG